MSSPVRAVFMGTPAISVPALDALVEVCRATGGGVVGVVCQPDRPAGRGMQVTPPPVKARALELGLEVTQPTKVRDGALARWIIERRADVALVLAYGRILPRDLLDAPRVGCLNVHASLLPKLRGAAPIAWAIARGEAKTGVGLMQMEEGLDTGPVLAELSLDIGAEETTPELSERIAALAAEIVRRSFLDAVEGRLTPRRQDDARATFAPILKKEDGVIDWRRGAREIDAHVRAMQPWPGAMTTLPNGKTLKLTRVRAVDATIATTSTTPGEIIVADKGALMVACGAEGHEAIAIVEAQAEGKRAMPSSDLVNGRVLGRGMRLGAVSIVQET